jgi:serine/threonine protein kinase
MGAPDFNPCLRGLFLGDQAPASGHRTSSFDPRLPPEIFVARAPVPRGSAPHTSRFAVRETTQRSERSFARTRLGLLQRGAIIDKFRIEDVLGVGGFAVVYRASHLLLQIPVAIKLLRPEIAQQPGVARQLLCEARFAARINHPNVVRIHDVTHTDEITFIVMEHIVGGSLSKAVDKGGALSPERVLRLGIDVAQGLKAGFHERLIHRDIKPANVLLGRDGAAQIVDFGLAVVASRAQGLPASVLEEAVVGTRGYMAPEQLTDPMQIDFRADIYALGVTLEEALFGVPPFASRRRAHGGVSANAPRSPTRARVLALARWMSAPRPIDRPASYDALLSTMQSELAAMARASDP